MFVDDASNGTKVKTTIAYLQITHNLFLQSLALVSKDLEYVQVIC